MKPLGALSPLPKKREKKEKSYFLLSTGWMDLTVYLLLTLMYSFHLKPTTTNPAGLAFVPACRHSQ
jgi:hypothetical protein